MAASSLQTWAGDTWAGDPGPWGVPPAPRCSVYWPADGGLNDTRARSDGVNRQCDAEARMSYEPFEPVPLGSHRAAGHPAGPRRRLRSGASSSRSAMPMPRRLSSTPGDSEFDTSMSPRCTAMAQPSGGWDPSLPTSPGTSSSCRPRWGGWSARSPSSGRATTSTARRSGAATTPTTPRSVIAGSSSTTRPMACAGPSRRASSGSDSSESTSSTSTIRTVTGGRPSKVPIRPSSGSAPRASWARSGLA